MSKGQDYSSLHTDDIVATDGLQKEALLAVNAYMDCWNNWDVVGLEGTLHFPHVRIASGKVNIMEAGSHPMDFFERFSANTGWAYSLWDYRRVVQSGPDKVHFAVQFTRYKADGTAFGAFPSMWIVALINGKWAIQARSSFAA